jgi:hypothetical protein
MCTSYSLPLLRTAASLSFSFLLAVPLPSLSHSTTAAFITVVLPILLLSPSLISSSSFHFYGKSPLFLLPHLTSPHLTGCLPPRLDFPTDLSEQECLK